MSIKIIKKSIPKIYRHGEIAFEVIKTLPRELKVEKTNIITKGNTNNSHMFKGGNFYPKNEDNYIFGYFEAKNTTLYHKEHGDKKNGELKSTKLPNGNYKLRRQVEFINGELRQIID